MSRTGQLGPRLRGREVECATLDRLVDDVRAGRSSVLVLRGESGHGKTALLDYAHGQASGCRVARVVGVDSEMELAFAGLHQLCAPMLDRLDDLPGPQQHALRVAFGLSGGEAPDRYLVGLAVLTLLSDMATEQPLVCVVDDAQWLDRASVQSLAFAARPAARELADATWKPPFLYELGPIEARKIVDDLQSGPVDKLPVDQAWITVPASVGDVRVRILKPQSATGPLPVILYMHGGGWVLGNAFTHDRLVRDTHSRPKRAAPSPSSRAMPRPSGAPRTAPPRASTPAAWRSPASRSATT
jgi:AAA ATPase domain